MNIRKGLTSIRKFFWLTSRDLGMQQYTVTEIAEQMKPAKVPGDLTPFPTEFAKQVSEIFKK